MSAKGFSEKNVYGENYLNVKKNQHYAIQKWSRKDGCVSLSINAEEFDTIMQRSDIRNLVIYYKDVKKSYVIDKEKADLRSRREALGKYEMQVHIPVKYMKEVRGLAV